MNDQARRREVVRLFLPANYVPTAEKTMAYAPVNIALIKYWGKRDIALHLPLTDSLSVTIDAGTTTTVAQSPREDSLELNGQPVDKHSPVYTRLVSFLNLIRPHQSFFFAISTINQIPTGAGLASSASGFAALVLALNRFFSWNLPYEKLSCLARLGSGSACRSICNGFVHWKKGSRLDGLDSYGEKIPAMWPTLRCGIFFISSEQKPISSTEAMQRTIQTSPLFPLWPSYIEASMKELGTSIEEKNFDLFGKTIEQNALTMHATMHSSWPPIIFWKPQTVTILHEIIAARSQGLAIYASMDAGPNIKVFFQKRDEVKILQKFPTLHPISLLWDEKLRH